ncbi:MAG TPA: stage V sporulation protein AD [Ruminococcaceae bacterium]|nr:stage V sporulation protein AD [Oscillospiraceae bacterium]HBG55338.1 stage V sporulation protein AD [Oscillospiraceae bacterium]HBQ47198.1 stage V sporulation protein AD [Oscillospiraceae bacterium]HBT91321.1 stage V sporulation protein AD [Oscillospiraceae bacterium]HCB91360.1 stage V sporulation protein AD [Oscillospiraceae bacterium]
MPARVGKYTIELQANPAVLGFASVVGKKESEGPCGQYYDQCHKDTTLGESSWEKAESRLQNEAIHLALHKANLNNTDVDCIFAGDLLNQCISSTFGLRSLDIPFLGQYGACSTMAQTLGIASLFVEAGAASRAAAVTSSHFCSAERQYRYPLEYGGQRTPTAQWTATAAGAVILGKREEYPTAKVGLQAVTFGRITDYGVKDPNNMGAAMAPAAAQTLLDYFSDTGTAPKDYDLILTGDLGMVGGNLLEELMKKEGKDISAVHNDCGLMIYDLEKQDVHAGGSGCGCSAAILCSVILQRMTAGSLHKVLFLGTGALLSPTSSQQGESIPSVAHLIYLKA